MVNLFAPSLQGDGIRFAFFHYLWSKNRGEDKENVNRTNGKGRGSKSSIQVRLPDTVIFRLGQPLQWYFTSTRGGRTSILQKRKQNVNVEKIEEVFVRKIRSTNKGRLDANNDIVAYFIASRECSSRNRQSSFGNKNTNDDTDGDSEATGVDDQTHANTCGIEYFNEEGLHQFLYEDRKNQTGILQRFIDPAGGGTHNSQIRAICAPKLCVLERRKTKQDLRDARFGMYERAVTFEGPEVYSTSLPIRGKALPGRLRELSNKVLNDISEAAMTVARTSDPKEDKRMVLNLKVDSKERIWVLYSSSIRSLPGSSEYISDIPSHEALSRSGPSEPLNIQNVIKLSPSIKLSQNANHDPNIVVSNKKTFDSCPSCAKIDAGDNFHPVPYKTIISHFEQVMTISRDSSSWPPHADIIKSAGGVGFGTVRENDNAQIEDEAISIPPVIRHLHERLKIDGYRRYRSDPLFLHRKCEVCESCFLAYAKLVSTSFQITRPIQMDTELERLGFAALEGGGNEERRNHRAMSKTSSLGYNKDSKMRNKKDPREKVSSSLGGLFLQEGPSLPPAIVDPPKKVALESDRNKFMPLPYEVIESPHQPLMHLLNMHQKLLTSKETPKVKKQRKKAKNPYAVPMKFVDASKQSSKIVRKKGSTTTCTTGADKQKRKPSAALHASTTIEEIMNGIQVNKSPEYLSKSGTTSSSSKIDSFGMDLLSSALAKLRNSG